MYTVSEFSRQVKYWNTKLIITVPELLDKVNGFNFPILLICHQKNSNLSVAIFTELVDKAGYVHWDNCWIKQSDIAVFCVLPMFHVSVLLFVCIHSCRGLILLCLWISLIWK